MVLHNSFWLRTILSELIRVVFEPIVDKFRGLKEHRNNFAPSAFFLLNFGPIHDTIVIRCCIDSGEFRVGLGVVLVLTLV